jgi:N-methylhydantoinase A
MDYIVGVDIGGTGTDCVVVDENGVLTVGKAFSTPPTFTEGVLSAVKIAAEKLNINIVSLLGNTRLFLHSTTVAENAVVDGTLAKGALLVTRGCEEILFMTRGAYGRWSGLTENEIKNPIATDKLPPIIPFSMIKGIKERTDVRGKVLVIPDKAEIEESIGKLVGMGAEAIGICFLWSFANPENENLVGEVLQKMHPELFFSLSSRLSPMLGEYERTSTVALNICLGPLVSKYLTNLGTALQENAFKGTLLIMQAYGGLLGREDASTQPVSMIESGPVSGLMGSKSLGDTLGLNNIVASDMGGTTFKAGVIREGRIEYQRSPMVLRYHYVLPKMDIVSIGLAGGSIISIDPRTNAPKVGPKSAGAHPGPICYGFGGMQPTVTDMDLILGYLNSKFYMEGRATLDIESAQQAFRSKVSKPMGMDIMEAASALCKLTNSLLYDMLHKMTVEKGLDPRDYVLFSYGGTAGMHLGVVGEELGMQKIIIPYAASVQGAYGLVSADIVHEDQTTSPMSYPVSVEKVNDIFSALIDKTIAQLKAEGFDEKDIAIERAIDMRYRRQVHLVTTPVETHGIMTESDLDRTCDTFERLYEERYGKESAFREAGIEIVIFRVRGIGALRKPSLKGEELAETDPEPAFVETRNIYCDNISAIREARGYDMERLLPGNEVEGPAIIWTPITTIVINPGQKATIDQYKNVILTW